MEHKKYSRFTLALMSIALPAISITVQAQDCKTSAKLETLPGKHIDAAHWEYHSQKSSWLNELETAANKTTATKVLTQIETLEKDSRKNFNLTGAVLKSSFGTTDPGLGYIGSKYRAAFYDLNLGVHEYICIKNKVVVNDEYSNVFRAYVNHINNPEEAFSIGDNEFFLTPYKYDGRFIGIKYFYRFKDKKLADVINSGKGYYQDIADDKVKQGNRSTYITRRWFIIQPGLQPLVPVTRKEYLKALLEYYEREKMGINKKLSEAKKEYDDRMGKLKNRVVKNSYEKSNEYWANQYAIGYNNTINPYRDYDARSEARKALLNKALIENSAEWLAQPAIVNPRPQRFSWEIPCETAYNDKQTVEATSTDTKESAQKYGSFAFTGFWDDKGGDILYKYNPLYFKNNTTAPAKPQIIELSFRYVKTPVGQRLIENFTNNFDFSAAIKLLE